MNIFHTALTYPLFNLLVFLYNTVAWGDLGVAIILLTLLIKIILWPFSARALSAQKNLQALQPRIKEIQQKHARDKEAQSRALLELYREHKVSPLGGCLPMLVQLPMLFALYYVFLNGLNPDFLQHLYGFVKHPGGLDVTFLGVLDLARPNIPLAFLAGALQFVQSKMLVPKSTTGENQKDAREDAARLISKQMVYFLPVLTVIISWRLPAGLPLYWVATTAFTIIQQAGIIRRYRGWKRAEN
jgi:YidC/Oxa1 family membrane protein insertase